MTRDERLMLIEKLQYDKAETLRDMERRRIERELNGDYDPIGPLVTKAIDDRPTPEMLEPSRRAYEERVRREQASNHSHANYLPLPQLSDRERIVTFANLYDLVEVIGQEVKALLDAEAAYYKAQIAQLRKDLLHENKLDRGVIADATSALRASVGNQAWKQQRRRRDAIQ
jgi:hypothetical protein